MVLRGDGWSSCNSQNLEAKDVCQQVPMQESEAKSAEHGRHVADTTAKTLACSGKAEAKPLPRRSDARVAQSVHLRPEDDMGFQLEPSSSYAARAAYVERQGTNKGE
mmetsp:Transcript_27315/g.68607  ORF Transcript_27315/g.68607 Transcript_27315/m.68607 type:complete len:107 (-) Transcript_27315:24-344(-)